MYGFQLIERIYQLASNHHHDMLFIGSDNGTSDRLPISANIAHFCTCQNSHVQKMYFCSMKKASINRKPLFMIGNADSNIV